MALNEKTLAAGLLVMKNELQLHTFYSNRAEIIEVLDILDKKLLPLIKGNKLCQKQLGCDTERAWPWNSGT